MAPILTVCGIIKGCWCEYRGMSALYRMWASAGKDLSWSCVRRGMRVDDAGVGVEYACLDHTTSLLGFGCTAHTSKHFRLLLPIEQDTSYMKADKGKSHRITFEMDWSLPFELTLHPPEWRPPPRLTDTIRDNSAFAAFQEITSPWCVRVTPRKASKGRYRIFAFDRELRSGQYLTFVGIGVSGRTGRTHSSYF